MSRKLVTYFQGTKTARCIGPPLRPTTSEPRPPSLSSPSAPPPVRPAVTGVLPQASQTVAGIPPPTRRASGDAPVAEPRPFPLSLLVADGFFESPACSLVEGRGNTSSGRSPWVSGFYPPRRRSRLILGGLDVLARVARLDTSGRVSSGHLICRPM